MKHYFQWLPETWHTVEPPEVREGGREDMTTLYRARTVTTPQKAQLIDLP